jgi:hypothetical protein
VIEQQRIAAVHESAVGPILLKKSAVALGEIR